MDSSVADTLRELNEKLETQAGGAQLYIATIDSLPLGKTIEDYSIEQAERIGAGDSKKDNGVLYTFVKSTRQDRLEVGYGLEDKLTDSTCAGILDAAHACYRRGDIGTGVKELASNVASVIQPDIDSDTSFVPPVRYEDAASEEGLFDKLAHGAVVLLVFALIMAWAYYKDTVLSSRPHRPYGSPSRPHASSSHHSSGSSHRPGGGHFGGGGASGGW